MIKFHRTIQKKKKHFVKKNDEILIRFIPELTVLYHQSSGFWHELRLHKLLSLGKADSLLVSQTISKKNSYNSILKCL